VILWRCKDAGQSSGRTYADRVTTESFKPSPIWKTGVVVDGPHWAEEHRTKKRRTRNGTEYQHGTVYAIDADGARAGYQSFDVYPELHVVLLDNADMGANAGDNGHDNRHQGGGRAMLDKLDELFPEPTWQMASSEFADHTQDGIDFMRQREGGGRRKVHTERCALERPEACQCFFSDKPPAAEIDGP
jgi:hypothetical protein